jgi:asparagine synthase (glutamine-hydrolysing)
MTAIAGLIRLDADRIAPSTIERMANLLAPYGRDAQHSYIAPSAAFLRTLLRVTPEDFLDHQPCLHTESQTLLLFDGRLDNREELAQTLAIAPAELPLMADSDLAMRAALHWGKQCVDRLLGDFALACWEFRPRRLWLARDPLGSRPLYWHRQAGMFAFATLPRALFAIPGIEKAVCAERLHDYLCLMPMTGPESFFKDVFRLEPGQILVLEDDHISTQRYYRWDPDKELQLPNDDDYLEAFRDQIERAVACRLRANGLIATHLSSGFDSSTVAALAARQLAARSEGLIAYTAVPREGFTGPAPKGRHADEGPAARAVAARFPNIVHHLVPTPEIIQLDRLDDDVDRLDRPPLNICNMAWDRAIEDDAVRRGAKVLLTGGMGNMTISYTGRQYLPRLLGQGHWWTWWCEAHALKRRERVRWRGLLLQSVGPYLPPAIWTSIGRLRRQEWDLLDYSAIAPGFMRLMDHKSRLRDSGWDLSYRPWADGRRMRIAVLNRFDNGDYQAAANAVGLERRDPTADRRLIEFCLAVPDRQYLRNGQTRWLLHRLMDGVLPPEILHARTKGYQAADWFESAGASLPRMREELGRLRDKGVGRYLDLDSLLESLDDWPETGWEQNRHVRRFRLKLLRGLSVGTFIRQVENDNR